MEEERLMQEDRIGPEQRLTQIDLDRPNLGLTTAIIGVLSIALILISYLLAELL